MAPRTGLLAIAALLACAGLAFAQANSTDLLLYNHSPSLPVGFYRRIDSAPRHGALVTVRATEVALSEAVARGFDGPRDRFIKRIAAASGDLVCVRDDIITINGQDRARRRAFDSQGHALAHWSGCRRLGADEYFLLGDTSDSFDSRYWGPVRRSQIEGVWRPL